MKELPQIYCDMDQVLVNFIGGANEVLKTHGLPEFPEADKEEKWSLLKTVPKFWANLKPMSDGLLLWKFIRPHNPWILSTPSRRMETSKPEKLEWIRKHLGNVEHVYLVPREHKQKFALTENGTANLLIDDHKKNIEEWQSKGGIGIRHINTMRTISQLKKLGF